MIDIYSDDSLNGWLIGPAGNLVFFLGNEMIISGLTQRAIIAAHSLPAFIAFAKANLPSESQETTDALENLLNLANTDANFASEEIDNQFNTVLSHHAVSTWAAIEATIEQTLVAHIRKVPDSGTLMTNVTPKLSGIKIKTVTERDAKNSIRIWEQNINSQSVIDRALIMLSAFGLSLSLPNAVKQDLSEMAEARNILLHRIGRVDDRFLSKCPWIMLKVGDIFRMNDEKMSKYFDAAHAFAIGLVEQTTMSPYLRFKPGNQ
jgi:hypothetical protein